MIALLLLQERRLRRMTSRPVSTNVIELRNPPSRVLPTFNVCRRRRALHARDRHAIRHLVGAERDRVEVRDHIGPEIGGRPDLVEKLRRDRAEDRDGAPGAGDAW